MQDLRPLFYDIMVPQFRQWTMERLRADPVELAKAQAKTGQPVPESELYKLKDRHE